MQSQIEFVDSQTLEPNPEVSAGKVIVSSKGLPWDGIYIEKGENEGFTPNNVTVKQHYFAMNAGPAFTWEWKDGKTFKTHRYETGDLWVNPAGTPFSHRISGHNQFVLLTLDPTKMTELLADHPLIECQTFRRQHQSQDKHLQLLIQALLVEAEMGGPNGRLYAETISTAISTHFVNHYRNGSPLDVPRLHLKERRRLTHVIEYIEFNLTAEISLSDLALEAGLSKFHFSRLFKDVFGLTPHKYIQKRRIEKAARALQKGDLTVAQVAHQYGFSDQSHFTHVFRRLKGVTPKLFADQSFSMN